MKTVKIEDLYGTKRDAFPTGCRSLRFLVESDGLGFSVHKTIIPKGGPFHWHYPHHYEACYCIQGSGVLTNLYTGEKHEITKDTLYALEKENHTFEALEDVVLISVFNPPVTGEEVHDENGHYPPSKNRRDLAARIVNACYESDNRYDALEEIEGML